MAMRRVAIQRIKQFLGKTIEGRYEQGLLHICCNGEQMSSVTVSDSEGSRKIFEGILGAIDKIKVSDIDFTNNQPKS